MKNILKEDRLTLGFIAQSQGKQEEARECYSQVIEKSPDAILPKFAHCIAQIPLVYRDYEQIIKSRNDYAGNLKNILEICQKDRTKIDKNVFEFIGQLQPSFLPYQGFNDRDLQEIYGKIVNKIFSTEYPQWSSKKDLPELKADEKIRIGFVSGFFHNHSVWKNPLQGWVNNLNRNQFELFGYYTQDQKDQRTDKAMRNFVKFVQGPLAIEEWGQIISDDRLHILIFSDFGIDPITLKLGALRLAPIQIAAAGHPETSGLPTIDYYLSSDLMEPKDGQNHYTEKLLRLPNLGFYYTPVGLQYNPKTKEEIGINKDDILFSCCQSLCKYLPQHDDIFPRIAREVRNSKFVFLESTNGDRVTNIFRKRLVEAFNKFDLDYQDHCLILPRLSSEDFAGLLSITNIFLDNIDWSGCNSTLESINFNIPIITLPGKLMRGRQTMAILKMMGIEETIASSKDEYIEMSVRLAQDCEYRANIAQKIATNKYKLYEDLESVEFLENFLCDLIYQNSIKQALFLHKTKQFPRAQQLYLQILEHNPKYEKAVYGLAILCQQIGKYRIAEKLLCSLLETKPDSFQAWFSLANVYQAQKYFAQAIKCYKKALAIQPSLLEADINLANALFEQGKSSLSTNQQEEYALKNYKLGVTRDEEGNLAIAQAYYQQTLKLKPNFIDAEYGLGKVFQAQGKIEQAKESYQKVISVDPNYGEAYYNLGTIYQDEGQLEEAAIFYKQGLKLLNR